MKKTIFNVSIILMILIVFGCQMNTGPAGPATPTPTPTPTPGEFEVELTFNGPDVGKKIVYAAWIEDDTGKNIHNLYVCTKLAADVKGPSNPLLGDAIPNWATKKYPQNTVIDSVTAASIQPALTVTRDLPKAITDANRKFRICFEIDRSSNSNTYFNDRPAVTFATEEIDLDKTLQPSYELTFLSWMANSTLSGTYSQAPLDPAQVPEFVTYTPITIPDHIEPLTDLVTSLTVKVRGI